MRWKLISLSVLLITATSAQMLTIENGIIYLDPVNATNNPNHTDLNSTSNERTAENEDETHGTEVLTVLPDIPETSVQSPNSTELNSLEPPRSTDDESNDILESEENTSNATSETSKSVENPSHEHSNSSGDASTEPESSQKLESVEILSGENNESVEKPDSHYIVSRSSQIHSNENSGEEPTNTNDGKMVQTTHGPVQGHKWHESEILAFIDIPYGKFIGYFDAPNTAQSWIDVHDVTEHTKQCPQLQDGDYIGDINCLTLSIFTPTNPKNASVLFHIHDGYSDSKSADPLIYGPEYLVPKGVILVLPNYRLGPMGFLCMQNETAPGNAGLKDLSLALEWVKENIHLFGGNPTNIIVSGDGVAGAFAGYLALCSRSRYYVNKVITESGSALSHWALDRNPLGTANTLAEKIRGEHSEGTIYNNTFEDASLETIIKAAAGMRLNPCLEHDKEPFMDDTPWKMLHDKEIDTTFMIGSASYAGTREAMETIENLIEQLNTDFSQFLPEDLVFKNDYEKQKLAQNLRRQYFGEVSISLSHLEELSLWYTDASYLGPTIRLARPLLKAGATVYFYEFAFIGNLNRELKSMNMSVPGAVRSDIVGYLFHKDGTTVEKGSPEEHMIHLMVDLWVSFINTGKPAAEHIQWNELKKVEESEEEWLLIDSESKMKKGVHLDRLQQWTSIYNEHFIEGNFALRHKPTYMVALITSLMCWLANTKLNYKSD